MPPKGRAPSKRPASSMKRPAAAKKATARKAMPMKTAGARGQARKAATKATPKKVASMKAATVVAKRPAQMVTRSPAKLGRKNEEVDGPNALGLPELAAVPSIFEFATDANNAFGIFVDETRCIMGDENGLVADVDRTTGEPVRTFRLPVGVKCVVGDGDYLYVGTNDGKIYDLTSDRPREVAQIEGFGEIYWIDIREGLIAASDKTGKVGMLNCEGEVKWQHACSGNDGWMCRMDATGVYHGTSSGVSKYSLRGDLLWKCDAKLSKFEVTFGVQTEEHVWVMTAVSIQDSPEQALAVKINKANGAVESKLQFTNFDSVGIAPDGMRVFDANLNVQPGNVAVAAWKGAAWKKSNIGSLDSACSQQILGDKLFAVGSRKVGGVVSRGAVFACFDLSDDAIAKAAKGGLKRTVSQRSWSAGDCSQEGTVAEDAEDVTTSEGKVVILCTKEGSKIRARVESPGYDSSLNCQFPRALREDGAKFVVDAVELAPSGDFYRCKGDPKRLRE